MRRAAKVVPRRLDEHPPQVLQLLQPGLALHRLPGGVDVVGEHLVVGLLGKRYQPYPRPVRGGPVLLPLPPGVRLAEGEPVPQQELRQPLLAALQVLARVVEGPGQVAGWICYTLLDGSERD